jgi:ankyrin repeat protein
MLLDNKASPILQDETGLSALMMCCSNGHIDICKLLYKNGARNELLNLPDESVFLYPYKLKTSLDMACMYGQLNIIEFLLENNADINSQSNQTRMTPLHGAVQKQQFKACEFILGYEQVSNQNLEEGMALASQMQLGEFQALFEKEIGRRLESNQSAREPEPVQKICSFCNEVPQNRKKCGKCKIAFYCSKECQSQHWTIHKLECSVD